MLLSPRGASGLCGSRLMPACRRATQARAFSLVKLLKELHGFAVKPGGATLRFCSAGEVVVRDHASVVCARCMAAGSGCCSAGTLLTFFFCFSLWRLGTRAMPPRQAHLCGGSGRESLHCGDYIRGGEVADGVRRWREVRHAGGCGEHCDALSPGFLRGCRGCSLL